MWRKENEHTGNQGSGGLEASDLAGGYIWDARDHQGRAPAGLCVQKGGTGALLGSAPKSFISCVYFVESVGGIEEADRHSYRPTVVPAFKDSTIVLKGGKPLAEKRKAPQTLLAIIIGLEDLVINMELLCRSGCMGQPLRVWRSLRFSGTRHGPPTRAIYDCGIPTVSIHLLEFNKDTGRSC